MSADVVVIGAGVIGASVAFHLAARGARVTVLERAPAAGQGSTGRATGGFRAQYGSDIQVRLSLLSREKLRRFNSEVGGDCGYRPCGYLWLARTASELAALEAAQRVQHAAGLTEARMIAPAEIALFNPYIRSQAVGAAFCPTDGFIRPLGILEGYLEAARRLGTTIEYDARVIAWRAGAVETTKGTFPAGAVVNAAGAWAREIASLAGVDLPVTPLRRQVAATFPCALLPDDLPMTLWAGDGFHLRVRDGRVLLLQPVDEPQGFDTSVDESWLLRIDALKRERIPALGAVALDRAACWAGLYEMSPDGHAIVGEAPGRPGFFLANGSSGHGVMHAPAIGQLLSELILDGRASLDLSALRPSRFVEGRLDLAPVLL
jgi:sarcosine oxidase subunit beta